MGIVAAMFRISFICLTKRKLQFGNSSRGLADMDVKEARQGVVGLCRASGIYYKREKKADTSAYYLLP
jgi:hypothetical protein